MISVECKQCKGINKIKESDYRPGSHVVVNCWRCGEDIEVDIPGDPETSSELQTVAEQNPSSIAAQVREDNEEIMAVPLQTKNSEVELEKARMVLEAEKIKLEHRRMDHEERMQQSKAEFYPSERDPYLPNHQMQNYPTKNKTTAGLLAIFLGGIGIHKFYLGKTGLGVVYLLFCWTYIPTVLGLIEGIIYFTKSDAEFHKSY